MKPQVGYALIENGRLAVYDYRLPICWKKRIAKGELKRKCFTGKIVKVRITEVKP